MTDPELREEAHRRAEREIKRFGIEAKLSDCERHKIFIAELWFLEMERERFDDRPRAT
jgi:hypothetical protein